MLLQSQTSSAERLYDRDPQPGMVWDRKRGWDVHARAPPVDERFLPCGKGRAL